MSLLKPPGNNQPPQELLAPRQPSPAVQRAPLVQVGQIQLTPRRAVVRPLQAPVAPAPDEAFWTRSNQLMARSSFLDAEQVLLQGVVEHPDSLRLRRNLVMVLMLLARHQAAHALLGPLLKALPDDQNLLLNHATVLFRLEHLHEARLALEDLLCRYPSNAAARVSLAAIFLNNLHDPEQALAVMLPALPEAEGDAGVQFALGCVHGKLGNFERALAHYARALEIHPGHAESLSNLLFTLHYVPPVDLDRVREIAQRHGQRLQHDARRRGWVRPAPPLMVSRKRLRIGLLSGDLRVHPVGHFLESVLDALRHRGVDLFAYASQGKGSVVSERMRGTFLRWHDVLDVPDQAVADLIAADDLDLLLDLSGHTIGNRLGVLLRRPAPRQVSWLGYFGTTGLPCTDAVIADPRCVPAQEERYFSERLLHMPHSRLCLTPPKDAPEVAAEPPMAVLPGITFGCFQNVHKINHRVLGLWQRILQAVPGAVLRLQNGQFEHATQVLRMRERLRDAGIDLRRVWISNNLPREHYLGQYAEVDVLLDTFPYPGGTTTAEAIWMGVPTLTLATPGMLGRQGQALMENVGLGDWVARSEDAYVARAVALAQDREGTVARLRQLRSDLRETARRSPLFDAQTFAADLERLLRQFCSE
jgi:Flp pilus assembly protein TadD